MSKLKTILVASFTKPQLTATYQHSNSLVTHMFIYMNSISLPPFDLVFADPYLIDEIYLILYLSVIIPLLRIPIYGVSDESCPYPGFATRLIHIVYLFK